MYVSIYLHPYRLDREAFHWNATHEREADKMNCLPTLTPPPRPDLLAWRSTAWEVQSQLEAVPGKGFNTTPTTSTPISVWGMECRGELPGPPPQHAQDDGYLVLRAEA